MAQVVFELTDLQAAVFEHFAYDPQEWIENCVRHQIELAKDEIVQYEQARMIADPTITHMPSDRDAIVAQANLIPAAQRLAEQQAGQE
jgi:uncharacterized DUF497 family protein